MKIVLREWFKRPKLMLMVLVELLCSSADIALGILGERLCAQIFDTQGDMSIIAKFAIVIVSALFINMIQKYMGLSIHMLYTELFNDLSNKILDAEYNMFLEFSCSRVISTSEQLWNIVGVMSTLRRIISTCVRIMFLIVAIHSILPALTLPVLFVYLIGAIILRAIYKRWYAIDKQADEIKRRRNKEFDETINGFKEVRGFSTQEYHREHMHSQNGSIFRLFKKRTVSTVEITSVFHIVYIISALCTVAYCVPAVKAGTISVAFAVLIVSYVEQISDPIEALLDFVDEISIRLARVDEYEKLMSYENSRVWKVDNLRLEAFNSQIEFKHVSFGYNDTSDVITDVNLCIPLGKHVGICGVSGGGKTTIFNLLMNYYSPSYGEILIDGINYCMLDASSIRSHIGIVNQDVYIFDNTLRFNISYPCINMHMDDDKIIEACQKANIWDFIKDLPDGLNTNVGPKGLKLSGGQKQRIGLARVFLADPEIILLDEATSALDNESETVVQEALNNLKGKTVVTIAHRLSTIRDSDIIYVIDNHTVAEKGTHDELMALNGVYTRLNK